MHFAQLLCNRCLKSAKHQQRHFLFNKIILRAVRRAGIRWSSGNQGANCDWIIAWVRKEVRRCESHPVDVTLPGTNADLHITATSSTAGSAASEGNRSNTSQKPPRAKSCLRRPESLTTKLKSSHNRSNPDAPR